MTQSNSLRQKIAIAMIISIALILGAGQIASAARFVPIPSLDAPSYASAATGVSQNGKVVAGWSDSDDGICAFKWTTADGVLPLGVGYMPGSLERVSQATAISADGKVIVGWTHYFDTISWDARKMAFIWTAEDGFDPIPASNGNNYIPRAISADGHVIVGEVGTGSAEIPRFAVIFHWDHSIEAVFGYSPWSQAKAIGVSHDGLRISGSGVYISSGYYPRRTFLRDEVGGFQFIGESESDSFTSASALSADGQLIAGILDATDSTVFRWKESTGLIDAGVFPGALNTRVLAVNESGNIMVGKAGTVNNWYAIIWNETDGFQNLADYATQILSIDLQGWQLTQANAITRRAIVGEGINPDGIQKAWVILFDIFGDSNNDWDVDGQDLFEYAAVGNFSGINNFTAEYGQ